MASPLNFGVATTMADGTIRTADKVTGVAAKVGPLALTILRAQAERDVMSGRHLVTPAEHDYAASIRFPPLSRWHNRGYTHPELLQLEQLPAGTLGTLMVWWTFLAGSGEWFQNLSKGADLPRSAERYRRNLERSRVH